MVIEHVPKYKSELCFECTDHLKKVVASNIFVEKHDPSFIFADNIGYHKIEAKNTMHHHSTGESWG
ncbi:hypothetical protein Scep_010499 [Stephania cephalantha]|uniref:Uncharacterized protein n=1 Tax=Stephania cephalantha TaxID=152367 RepID=A0AAP0JV62_9MAGN